MLRTPRLPTVPSLPPSPQRQRGDPAGVGLGRCAPEPPTWTPPRRRRDRAPAASRKVPGSRLRPEDSVPRRLPSCPAPHLSATPRGRSPSPPAVRDAAPVREAGSWDPRAWARDTSWPARTLVVRAPAPPEQRPGLGETPPKPWTQTLPGDLGGTGRAGAVGWGTRTDPGRTRNTPHRAPPPGIAYPPPLFPTRFHPLTLPPGISPAASPPRRHRSGLGISAPSCPGGAAVRGEEAQRGAHTGKVSP